MEVTVLTVGPVFTNCYIVNEEGKDSCLVIDPGDEAKKIAEYIQKRNKKMEAILLTHGHFDHMIGVRELMSLLGGKLYAYQDEKELLMDPQLNVSNQIGYEMSLEADVLLRDHQKITVAGMTFEVIHTPGHTKGSCCYYSEEHQTLFSGDTIFMESVGRTDLPTGNERELIDSVRNRVLTLPSNVKIYPGHGPETNVAYEVANNPYA